MNLEGKWTAIWIGGGIAGLASLLPVLHLACCLIPFGAAIIAVAIYANAPVRPALQNNDGIVLGAMTGLIGTLVFTVIALPLVFIFGNALGSYLRSIVPNLSDLPQNAQPFLQDLLNHFGSVLAFLVILKILTQLGLFFIFGILGGLAGVAIFRRRS